MQVVVYSWDGYSSGTWRALRKQHPTPDDDAFVFLAKTYANNHKTLSKSRVGCFGLLWGSCVEFCRSRMAEATMQWVLGDKSCSRACKRSNISFINATSSTSLLAS